MLAPDCINRMNCQSNEQDAKTQDVWRRLQTRATVLVHMTKARVLKSYGYIDDKDSDASLSEWCTFDGLIHSSPDRPQLSGIICQLKYELYNGEIKFTNDHDDLVVGFCRYWPKDDSFAPLLSISLPCSRATLDRIAEIAVMSTAA